MLPSIPSGHRVTSVVRAAVEQNPVAGQPAVFGARSHAVGAAVVGTVVAKAPGKVRSKNWTFIVRRTLGVGWGKVPPQQQPRGKSSKLTGPKPQQTKTKGKEKPKTKNKNSSNHKKKEQTKRKMLIEPLRRSPSPRSLRNIMSLNQFAGGQG